MTKMCLYHIIWKLNAYLSLFAQLRESLKLPYLLLVPSDKNGWKPRYSIIEHVFLGLTTIDTKN